MDILAEIKNRRSVRRFKKETVPSKSIEEIVQAGRWAPSGLNNQPWRFMVLAHNAKNQLADYTKYGDVILSADKCILVFLDKEAMYDKEKDIMAIGASIQNMLLIAHGLKLGACWLGEILNQRRALCKHLGISKELQLEAVIAIGHPAHYPEGPGRKNLKKLLI
jgi:nitroreductase